MIWLPLCAAFAFVGAGGAAAQGEKFKEEWAKWMSKDHKELKRDSSSGVAGATIAPLRVAKQGGKPLWMEDSDTVTDEKLTEALAVVDSTERKATHWTLNDRGDSQPSKGDGGA
jgi:hypothetical protein